MATINIANPGGFPGSHVTSTTTTIKVEPLIWFDPTYVQTETGKLKVAVVVLNLLAFIFASVSYCYGCSSVTFFNLTAMLGFWVSIILLALYLFHAIEKIAAPWHMIEFIFCAFWTLFYLIVSLVIVFNGGAYIVAGFLGFAAGGVYAYDSHQHYLAYQRQEPAQGGSLARPHETI